MEEEVKGDQQPKLHTMKACIVSMEYAIKNSDATVSNVPLGESYKDADKVKQLFEKTLGWDQDDVSTF
jgi:hypothetical protein